MAEQTEPTEQAIVFGWYQEMMDQRDALGQAGQQLYNALASALTWVPKEGHGPFLDALVAWKELTTTDPAEG